MHSAFECLAANVPHLSSWYSAAAITYPMTKVLIQRIGLTLVSTIISVLVARALRIFGIQQHLVRHCAYLHRYLPAFGLFQHPTGRARKSERFQLL